MLLALLATPFLALAGVPLRLRLVATACLIALYVPVAGAGPSIQRAGVMGVAGIVAALASRPRHRWYALGLAATVTLAVDPRAAADVGWQLSFAAVAGLLVLVQPMVRALAPSRFRSPLRRALAEGAAMTLAATLATGPLVAHHFGTVSLTAIPANLIALPAVAPAMWLGMLAGALGQVPGAPVEPLAWLGGHFAGYIGWVARLLGGEWAQVDLPEPGLLVALAWSAALVALARIACPSVVRRARLRPVVVRGRRGPVAVAALVGVMGAVWLGSSPPTAPEPGVAPRLSVRFLDVGQGDAILLAPRGRDPVLVDTGPPEGEAASRLHDLGIERLAAVAITHDQRDHAGALAEILAEVEVGRLLVGASLPAACESVVCPRVGRVGVGDTIRAGRLRIHVLWPPARAAAGEDPNAASLVLRVEAGDFDLLLSGDAEAASTSYERRPVDVLKIAHHGSADAGLPALLQATSPALGVISVGANGYGHPTPETLADLASAGVPVARTDAAGEILIEVRGDGWRVG